MLVGVAVEWPGDGSLSAYDAGVPQEYEFEQPTTPGTASVGGEQFDTVSAAVAAAEPGDVVRLSGVFAESVTVDVPNVTLASKPGTLALIRGGDDAPVVTLAGDGSSVERLWVQGTSGVGQGVAVTAPDADVVDSRITDVAAGIQVDSADDVTLANNTIVGSDDATSGNGIHLWKSERVRLVDNRITDVHTGVRFSWASGLEATGNRLWDLDYAVRGLYTDDGVIRDNQAFDNGVGLVLFNSHRFRVVNNTAYNNTGNNGHGILMNTVDDSTIRHNTLVGNERGISVNNADNNTITDNEMRQNDVGVYYAAMGNTLAGNTIRENRIGLVKVKHPSATKPIAAINTFERNEIRVKTSVW
ncbi:nitrous oxide reductase family maturation protein NosD [Halobacteriaceae archaeon GCM10025711]